jgi:hypothetical protein
MMADPLISGLWANKRSAPGRAPRTWERTPIGGSLQVEARSQLPGTPRSMGGARHPW